MWKDIVFEGKQINYQVSDSDHVRNSFTKNQLKPRLNNTGRYIIDIYPNKGDKRTVLVHRLVAMMFIPNPENKETVNHKDGNKIDNHHTNLEWNTYGENNQHAYDIGLKQRIGSKHNFAKFNDFQVKQICSFIINGLTGKEIAEKLNLDKKKAYPYVSCIKKKKIRRNILESMDENKFHVVVDL